MDADLQREVNAVIKKLRGVSGYARKNIKGDLADGAKIIQAKIKGAAPIGKKRYKVKGEDHKIGTLKRSVKILRFQRAKSAVFVGLNIRGERIKSGFYGRFIEDGTINMRAKPFIAPAAEASKGQAMQRVVFLLKKRIEGYIEKASTL